ncbi:hypothetical protein M378DRAFT_159660 [Amanita muscaria Koide BX008]|uniref:Uncharacterized protein n=1 Tax=Amanita muscaria (strain Koide BX008) TaxID=946122 RepID=A0A0C2XCV1_AMAMK|nr:hypothetical protein M378DRAFT_159660 [Amanita muscaria Koide BX008]
MVMLAVEAGRLKPELRMLTHNPKQGRISSLGGHRVRIIWPVCGAVPIRQQSSITDDA